MTTDDIGDGIRLERDRHASDTWRVYDNGQAIGKVAMTGAGRYPWTIVSDSYPGRTFENRRIAARALSATRRLLTGAAR